MNLTAAISSEDTLKFRADTGGRSREKIQRDNPDVRELIAVCGFRNRRRVVLSEGEA
jgi:hypothetical protein